MEVQLHHQQQFFINFVTKGRFGFKITSFNVNSINAHAFLENKYVSVHFKVTCEKNTDND